MSSPAGTVHVGLAAGHSVRDDVEHLLDVVAERHGPVVLACTHVVDGRWAGSVQLAGPAPAAGPLAAALGAAVVVHSPDGGTAAAGSPLWRTAAERAAQSLRDRTDGRAVRFGGQDRLVGEVPADDVPSLSAVEALVGVAGTPTAGVVLVTRDFVRPVLREGRLVLQVRPIGADGAVAPFEVPDPTPCCAAHG